MCQAAVSLEFLDLAMLLSLMIQSSRRGILYFASSGIAEMSRPEVSSPVSTEKARAGPRFQSYLC